ncbi:CBS domain-containing protein [Rhizobium sp. C1]|uniref:CBS domain-containing protein n=1 Tax=Rhizobium sp. C1 TaxID=1349799 RepID=UPI001E46CD8F|nr:CBS domain-containing protein [Rhizobium sp. C1]MCD2176826.1 CBS domain-containing protein [Rhizobium sp. C1]
MNVKAILNEKGSDVVTIGPKATVADVAKVLHERRIGAVVVVDDSRRIVGIIAERDIVGAIADHGASCLSRSIADVMWSNVYRCTEDMTVDSLMQLMSARRARHIPVERDGRLVGIISIGDVVKAHIRAIESEAEHIKAYIAG